MDTKYLSTCKWRRVETVLLWALLLAPLAFAPHSMLVSHYKATYINLAACLLMGAFVFRSLFRCGFSINLNAADLVLGAFCLLAAISFFWSLNTPVYLQRFTLLLSITCAYYLIRIRTTEQDSVFRFVVFLVFIGVLAALVDSSIILYNRYFSPESVKGGYKASSFLFPHDNVAALYLIILVPLAFSAIYFATKIWKKAVISLGVVPLLGCLFLLESRAAIAEAVLAFVIITLCVVFKKRVNTLMKGVSALLRRRTVLILLAVILVCVFLLPLSKSFSAWAKAGFMEVVNSFNLNFERSFYRLDIWRRTMVMVTDNLWLGVGLGNFPVVFQNYHKLDIPRPHPHNEFFNILSELGVAGLAIYAVFLIMVLRAFVNSYLRGRGKDNILALGLGCSLCMVLLHGIVEPPLVFEASALNMFVSFALIISMESLTLKKRIVQIPAGGVVRRFVLPGMVMVGLVLAVPWLVISFSLDGNIEKGKRAYASKDFQMAEACYRRILTETWGGHEIHMLLGNTYFYQNKYEDALNEYEKAQKLFPYYYKIYYMKGCVLRRLNRPEEAIQALTQCLIHNPRYVMANLERIRAYKEMGDYEETLRRLRIYIRSKRPTFNDYKMASECYLDAEKSETDKTKKLEYLKNALAYAEKAVRAFDQQVNNAQHPLKATMGAAISHLKHRILLLEKELDAVNKEIEKK